MTLPEHIPQGLSDGRLRDLMHLTGEDFDLVEIANTLAKINRFAGATRWPYSVATHSVLVSRLCPSGLRMAGLLHDITEAFGIGDIISPVKHALGPNIRELEERLRVQLAGVFPALANAHHADVVRADKRAVELESIMLRGQSAWDGRREPIHADVLGYEEAQATRGLDVELSWTASRELFLRRCRDLRLSGETLR